MSLRAIPRPALAAAVERLKIVAEVLPDARAMAHDDYDRAMIVLGLRVKRKLRELEARLGETRIADNPCRHRA